MARSVNSEAWQRRTASTTASSPATFRKLSCWPAKLACGKSSAVAELRTATRRSGSAHCCARARQALRSAVSTATGMGQALTIALA